MRATLHDSEGTANLSVLDFDVNKKFDNRPVHNDHH
jgi:hypothetical protein